MKPQARRLSQLDGLSRLFLPLWNVDMSNFVHCALICALVYRADPQPSSPP